VRCREQKEASDRTALQNPQLPGLFGEQQYVYDKPIVPLPFITKLLTISLFLYIRIDFRMIPRGGELGKRGVVENDEPAKHAEAERVSCSTPLEGRGGRQARGMCSHRVRAPCVQGSDLEIAIFADLGRVRR